MSRYFIVITTTDKKDEAQKISFECINNKLASCSHIFEIKSEYWWEGKIENSNEYRIEFKTTKKNVMNIIKKIKSIHSYKVPEIIVLPIITGEKDYLKWIKDSVK